ncbi:hypothetical protein [Roseovarius sp. CH_XMU1461]|uniref:hypothetical protein n=1 Tax=Roseovarius sp. CH_XMU1461 TaxID=3107777 RepID=UPI00300814C9
MFFRASIATLVMIILTIPVKAGEFEEAIQEAKVHAFAKEWQKASRTLGKAQAPLLAGGKSPAEAQSIVYKFTQAIDILKRLDYLETELNAGELTVGKKDHLSSYASKLEMDYEASEHLKNHQWLVEANAAARISAIKTSPDLKRVAKTDRGDKKLMDYLSKEEKGIEQDREFLKITTTEGVRRSSCKVMFNRVRNLEANSRNGGSNLYNNAGTETQQSFVQRVTDLREKVSADCE